jgi:hypothetical protein
MRANYSLPPVRLHQASAWACGTPPALAVVRPLSLGRGLRVGQVNRFIASAGRGRRIATADFSPTALACRRSRPSRLPVRSGGVRRALTSVWSPWFGAVAVRANPPVDPVPFGHWTLRDEAAQRRSPAR